MAASSRASKFMARHTLCEDGQASDHQISRICNYLKPRSQAGVKPAARLPVRTIRGSLGLRSIRDEPARVRAGVSGK